MILLWALPTWRNGPNDVDVREVCATIVRLARPGDRVVIDRYLTAARVCLPDSVDARYVNGALSVAPAADIVTARVDDGPAPPGFVEAARIPGKWWSVIVYRKIDSVRKSARADRGDQRPMNRERRRLTASGTSSRRPRRRDTRNSVLLATDLGSSDRSCPIA